MKQLLVIIFLLMSFGVKSQVQLDVDTSGLSKDSNFVYFKVDSLVYKDYLYQFEYRTEKAEFSKLFDFKHTRMLVTVKVGEIDIQTLNCNLPYFKFILWIKNGIYLVYSDNCVYSIRYLCEDKKTSISRN